MLPTHLMPRPPRQPRQSPNQEDPLSEATPQRRLWAAYLRAGFTRADFSRAVGIAYHTLDAWDIEAAMPDLPRFAKAAELVGYTIDELMYGHGGMHAKRGVGEPALTTDGVRVLLDQIRATPEQAEALAEHRQSTRGTYARFTATYVRTFVHAFAFGRQHGLNPVDARIRAAESAENAQAAADAHSRGVDPVSPEKLSTLAQRIRTRFEPTAVSAPVRKKKRAAKAPRRSVD